MKQPLRTLLYAILLLVSIAYTKNTIAQSPPGTYTDLASGAQTLDNDTVKGTHKWYRWVADTGVAHVGIKLKQQGINKQLAKAELYTVNSGTLVIAFRDTLAEAGDSTLNLYAGYIPSNTEFYIKVLNASGSCTSCAVNEPIVTVNVENVMPQPTGMVNACDMVPNGNFETRLPGAPCGGFTHSGILDSWIDYEGTSDVYTRFCTASGGVLNLGTNTGNSNPILNSRNGIPNNSISGHFFINNWPNSLTGLWCESIQTPLTTPLLSGRQYSLSCWIYNYSGTIAGIPTNTVQVPCYVTVATSGGIITPPNPTNGSYPNGNPPFVLKDFLASSINTWSQYTYTFTYSGAPHQNLLMGGNYPLNLSAGFINVSSSRSFYLFFDDVSLIDISPIGIAVNQNQPHCDNNLATFTLTAGGSTNSYTWQPGGFVGNQIVVSPTVNTTYTINSTNPNGCPTTAIKTLTILPAPQGTITNTSGSNTICPGAAVTLSTTGGSYNQGINIWTPSPCIPSNCMGPSITVSPSVTTTYTVKLWSANGCTNTAQSTITVLTPSNAISVSGNTLICSGGQSTTLTATGGSNYTWTPGGSSSASITVSPTVTTSYTVTGTYTCGGTATTVVTVSVTPPPTLTLVATPTIICSGNSSVLSASGASSYTWNPGALTGASVTVSPTVTTTYTTTGNVGNCNVTKTITVTVKPKPTVTVNSTTICIGNTATLTANGATTYNWNTGATTQVINVNPTINTSYTVTGTTNGCTNTAVSNVAVTSNTIPAFSVFTNPSSPVIANGTGTNVIGLTTTGITNTVGLTFAWSNSATTPTTNFNLTQPEIISLTVSNPYCGTSTQSICVNYVAASCSNTTIPVLNNAIITSSTQITAGVYRVTGTLTFSLSGAINVSNKTFMMATNSKIIVSPRTTLLNHTGLRIYSCDGMWNGIELQADASNAAAVNILDDAIIEDAYIGISAGTTTLSTMHSININGANTQFNKNYIDIKIVNTNLTSSVYTFTFSGKGMFSKSSTNSPGGNLKCSSSYTPIVKSRSLIGLQAKDAGIITFTVPNGGGTVNTEIQNKDYGLFFNNTDADVNNVNFNNAVGVAYSYSFSFASAPAGVGIYTKNSKYLNVKPATTPTVGATTTFSNMGYSIISHGTSTVDVQNTNHTSSVQSYTYDPAWGSGTKAYIWGGPVMLAGYGLNGIFATNPSGVLRINNNTFSQNYYPITVNYTATPSASVILSVAQNTISATGTGVITEGTTINSTLPFFGTSTDNMRVAANTYTNVQLGVKATAIKSGLRISNNIITLKSTGSRAISLSGSNNAIADANTIIGNNSTSISNIGIFVENSGGCKIKCNTITNTGHGVEFRGNNSSSGDGFFGNTLNYPMRRGLVLSVGGIIGAQGSSGGASFNQWIGWPTTIATPDPNQTFVGGTPPGGSASDAVNSPLYVHNNATELPIDNSFAAPSIIGNRYLLSVNMFTTTAGNTSTCPNILTQGLRTNGTATVDNTDRDNDFVNYINNLVPAANADLTPQDKFMLKQYMFEALSQNPSTNSTIANFYNQQQTGSINAYYDIDSLLAAGNIALANAKNNQASQTNDITQTQNTYNAIYINGINNQTDLDNLIAIANLCPSLYGNAVFEARALVQSITYVGKMYNDSCDNSQARKKLWIDDETSSVSVAEGVQAKLYPNPNNGMFMLAYDLKTRREANITILDVTGKLVYTGSIDNLNNVIEINTSNLQSGIYFIQLVHDKTLLWTDKLMISK